MNSVLHRYAPLSRSLYRHLLRTIKKYDSNKVNRQILITSPFIRKRIKNSFWFLSNNRDDLKTVKQYINENFREKIQKNLRKSKNNEKLLVKYIIKSHENVYKLLRILKIWGEFKATFPLSQLNTVEGYISEYKIFDVSNENDSYSSDEFVSDDENIYSSSDSNDERELNGISSDENELDQSSIYYETAYHEWWSKRASSSLKNYPYVQVDSRQFNNSIDSQNRSIKLNFDPVISHLKSIDPQVASQLEKFNNSEVLALKLTPNGNWEIVDFPPENFIKMMIQNFVSIIAAVKKKQSENSLLTTMSNGPKKESKQVVITVPDFQPSESEITKWNEKFSNHSQLIMLLRKRHELTNALKMKHVDSIDRSFEWFKCQSQTLSNDANSPFSIFDKSLWRSLLSHAVKQQNTRMLLISYMEMRKLNITIDQRIKVSIAKYFAKERCLEGSWAIFADSVWIHLVPPNHSGQQINSKVITEFQLPHDWFSTQTKDAIHKNQEQTNLCQPRSKVISNTLVKDLSFLELTIESCYNFTFGWLNDLHQYTCDYQQSPSFTPIPEYLKFNVQFSLSCYQLTRDQNIAFQNFSSYSNLIRMCALVRYTQPIPELTVQAFKYIHSNLKSAKIPFAVSREYRLSLFRDLAFSYALNHELDSLIASLQLLFPSEIQIIIPSIRDLCARFGNANLANQSQNIFENSVNDKIAHLSSPLTPISPFCDFEDILLDDLNHFNTDKDSIYQLKFYSSILSTFESVYPPTVNDLRQLSSTEKWIKYQPDEVEPIDANNLNETTSDDTEDNKE